LHIAAQYCDEASVVTMLLDAGASPHARTRRTEGITEGGRTPLHYASLNRNVRFGAAAVQVLVNRGAAVNVLDTWQTTPLAVACENERYGTARALVVAGGIVQLRGKRVPEDLSVDDAFDRECITDDTEESRRTRRFIQHSTELWAPALHLELAPLCTTWVSTVLCVAHRLDCEGIAPRLPPELWLLILRRIPIPQMKAALPHAIIGQHSTDGVGGFDFD
jgi:hypothetical protein